MAFAREQYDAVGLLTRQRQRLGTESGIIDRNRARETERCDLRAVHLRWPSGEQVPQNRQLGADFPLRGGRAADRHDRAPARRQAQRHAPAGEIVDGAEGGGRHQRMSHERRGDQWRQSRFRRVKRGEGQRHVKFVPTRRRIAHADKLKAKIGGKTDLFAKSVQPIPPHAAYAELHGHPLQNYLRPAVPLQTCPCRGGEAGRSLTPPLSRVRQNVYLAVTPHVRGSPA